MPSGWGEEFDKEGGIIRIVQPLNPRVMGINIWYDSDEEVTNAREKEGLKIIICNKGNNTKVASQEAPQITNRKQITKKFPPSVNHVTRSGRVYQPPKKEKEVSKRKEMSSDAAPTKEEDDLVLK